jgi:hypothetical protein
MADRGIHNSIYVHIPSLPEAGINLLRYKVKLN